VRTPAARPRQLEAENQYLRPPKFALSLLARTVVATSLIDRSYWLFDRLRSRMVLACGSDEFYDIYNDLTYARQDVYRAGAKSFRSNLFPFEERAISCHFPAPPGTVLVGAAGGGREALALASRGYHVIACEPVSALATSLAQSRGELPIEVFVGRYERLPMVSLLDDSSVNLDLHSRAPFVASILGWASFSNLRSDEHRVETLKQFGSLTRGPILVSYYPAAVRDSTGPRFSHAIGFYQTFTGSQFRALVERASLKIIFFDDEDNWPHAVLQGCAHDPER
jgi:hypothetical protein